LLGDVLGRLARVLDNPPFNFTDLEIRNQMNDGSTNLEIQDFTVDGQTALAGIHRRWRQRSPIWRRCLPLLKDPVRVRQSWLKIMLDNRDYTLILDKSGSMSMRDQPGGKSRCEEAQESTVALARKCEEKDPDGITVYMFASRFRRYDNVTSTKVAQLFQENEPVGSTNLGAVLTDALNNYFQRKQAGQTKADGETILVITDGEPNERRSVMEAIIEASRQMERDEELAISFIQIGTDPQATRFLKALDDDMQSVGAKFDIVDTVTIQDMEEMSLTEVLLSAIQD